MQVSLSKTLKKLFPPGEALEEDEKFERVIDSVSKEFDKVLRNLEEIVKAAVPTKDSLFLDRWKMLTNGELPETILKSKGFSIKSYVVSNNLDHFKALVGPEVKIKASRNQLSFENIQNKRFPLRCGGKAGDPLATFKRDEVLIHTLEKVKHAHIINRYEENNAQNRI